MHADAPRAHHVMSNDLICASEDLALPALVNLVVRNHIGCLPVVDRLGRAVGVVTKSDLVEHLDSLLRNELPATSLPAVPRAKDLMMPLPLMLPESASLAQAATLMVLEDVHHVLIVSDAGFLVGVVSTKDLVHWMVETDRLANLP
jgi:CBS domain-containing protein